WVAHNALTGGSWKLIPNELDGAEHRAARMLMNPWFSPKAVNQLKDKIRERAVGLIDRMLDKDSCEFMEAFGRPFPITIFLELMGFPVEQLDTFLKWEFDLLHTTNHEDRARASAQIIDFLWGEFCDRRVNPRDDLTTKIATAELGGEPLNEDQAKGMLYSLFAGGLDTVASSLSFYFHYLARHPELQARLRADLSLVPYAIEEFLRRFSPVNARRMAAQDVELGGVTIRKGEWVFMGYALASLDPTEFPDPMTVDIDRRQIRHAAFASGPHFCIGAHLAKMEIKTALEEWLTRVPPFRAVEGAPTDVHGGGVYGHDSVHLRWD
ncbi:MAG: cytochrome P450, partial [Sphingobium sp.]